MASLIQTMAVGQRTAAVGGRRGRGKGVHLYSCATSLTVDVDRMAEAVDNTDGPSSLCCLCFGGVGFGGDGKRAWEQQALLWLLSWKLSVQFLPKT